MKNISLFFVFLFVEGVFGETVSENEGSPITLRPGLTEIKNDDVIDWRFQEILIARVRNNNVPTTYEDALDGKFRGRLQLNGQTGDLNITNTKTTDTGVYEVSNSINTFKKTFTVNVDQRPSLDPPTPSLVRPTPSSGAAAGIVNAVVLLVAAAAAVIATR